MSYIGNDLKVAYNTYLNIDDISGSFNGSTTSFPLLVRGAAPTPLPLNSQQCLISVGGVLQRPDDTGSEGFRLSGGNIVFSSAPATGEDFFGVILAGADYVNVGANFPDGSAAVPSITFDQNSTTGFYRSGSGTVSFTSNSVQSAIFSSSDLTAPSFIPTSSVVPSSGVFLPGANTLGLSTNTTERARIDSSGRLLLGTSTARANYFNSTLSAALQIEGTGHDSSSVTITRNSNDGSAPTISLAKSRGTATGSNTVVQSGDDLGYLAFQGSDGSEFVGGAYIYATVDGTPGANDLPTRLSFSVTRDGASSPTEAMRINSTGTVDVYTPASGNYAMRVLPGGGADRAILLAGIGGVTNGFRADWINAASLMAYRFNDIATTAAAANAHLDSGDSNRLYRSTSSLRYKKDIEDIEQGRADAVLSLRPVWYRSKSSVDPSDWSWYGLIAEEVAAVEPRLVHWTYLEEDYKVEEVNGQLNKTPKEGAQKVPDGVQYDRLAVLLLDVVKRQQQTIEALEARVTALETA